MNKKTLIIDDEGNYSYQYIDSVVKDPYLSTHYIVNQLERITKKLQLIEDKQRDIDHQTANNTKG